MRANQTFHANALATTMAPIANNAKLTFMMLIVLRFALPHSIAQRMVFVTATEVALALMTM